MGYNPTVNFHEPKSGFVVRLYAIGVAGKRKSSQKSGHKKPEILARYMLIFEA